MKYNELLKNRILYYCNKKRYSICELARLSDVKQSTIENLMLGITKNPGIVMLHKIANALNMTLAEFLDFDELNNFSFDDEEK